MASFLDSLNPNFKALVGLASVIGSIWAVGEHFGSTQQEMSDEIHVLVAAIDGKDGLKDQMSKMSDEINKHSQALAVLLGKNNLDK